ncbi:MAG: RNA pyrophosphohydrolase [Epsilonproteobacteria bacterium]|nr:RNA pyrophosphohydrolase [Campylobacterota bacterium]
MEKFKDYRPNVAAIVLSWEYPHKKRFLLARRKGIKRSWQFPQGGINKGEEPLQALLRELKEEIGTDEVEILGEYPEWITYDFPKGSNIKREVYPFRGQRQKYFLVKLKKDANIDLNSYDKPEFEEYIFVDEDELFKKVTFMKRNVYKKVYDYFKEKGLL